MLIFLDENIKSRQKRDFKQAIVTRKLIHKQTSIIFRKNK